MVWFLATTPILGAQSLRSDMCFEYAAVIWVRLLPLNKIRALLRHGREKKRYWSVWLLVLG